MQDRVYGLDETWPAEAQLLYLNLCERLDAVDWSAARDVVIEQVSGVYADAAIATRRDTGGRITLRLPGQRKGE